MSTQTPFPPKEPAAGGTGSPRHTGDDPGRRRRFLAWGFLLVALFIVIVALVAS